MGCTLVLPGGLLVNGYVSSSTLVEFVAGSGPIIYSCQNRSVKFVAPNWTVALAYLERLLALLSRKARTSDLLELRRAIATLHQS
jgi:hypothetical protein